MPLDLAIVPCLADNYCYVVHDPATDTTTAVDVPDAVPVLRALGERGWKLSHILLTHHHADHIDGVRALAAATGARVIGAAADAYRLPRLTEEIHPDDTLHMGMETVRVIEASGHTVGHLAYHFPQAKLAFTGDSLMSWGCGRLFEGTPAQMHDTLNRLAALPDDTLICSGHEYTEANGRFALSLEPDHPALLERMAATRAARAKGEPTVPVLLSTEKATNPFLRTSDPGLRAALGMENATDLEVFTEIRARKDRF